MEADAPEIAPGDVLDGKYVVERVLGRGGMGVVVAAHHKVLQTRVAVKVVLDKADANTLGRFHREARSAVRLQSPHTARVHDVGQLPDGRPYMVMDLLTGRDLASITRAGGRLPIEDAVGWIRQALEAIEEAHGIGIVHRDLKPANLFLHEQVGSAPTLKVLDFGIARDFHDIHDQRLTATSAVIGSPAYMSPEQSREARQADARSDIWSIGVTLYELLTGVHPFQAETLPDLFVAILAKAPVGPDVYRPDLPPALGAVVLRCLEKDPSRRFQSARDLSTALAPFASPRASWPNAPGALATRVAPLAAPQRKSDPAIRPSDPAFAAGPRRSDPALTVTVDPPIAGVTRFGPLQAPAVEAPAPVTTSAAGGGSPVAAALIGLAIAGVVIGGVGLARARLGRTTSPPAVASAVPAPPAPAETATSEPVVTPPTAIAAPAASSAAPVTPSVPPVAVASVAPRVAATPPTRTATPRASTPSPAHSAYDPKSTF